MCKKKNSLAKKSHLKELANSGRRWGGHWFGPNTAQYFLWVAGRGWGRPLGRGVDEGVGAAIFLGDNHQCCFSRGSTERVANGERIDFSSLVRIKRLD